MSWSDSARAIDVSHWNADDVVSGGRTSHRLMDWAAAVQQGGCAAAIVKYSQGFSGADPAAWLHAYNAWRAGVPLLGAYHFGTGDGQPELQAGRFLDLVYADYGTLKGVMLMLDAERALPQMGVVSAERWVSYVHQRTGRWPKLYMGRSGPDGTGRGLPSAVLSQCDLVLPAYGDHADDLGAVLPPGWRLPSGAGDKGEPGRGVVRLWQFTDGTINGGPFPGLGRVDQSRFIGSDSLADAWQWWAS